MNVRNARRMLALYDDQLRSRVDAPSALAIEACGPLWLVTYAGEPESIMIGRAEDLAVDLPLPEGGGLRRIRHEADVQAFCRLQAIVFEIEVEPVRDTDFAGIWGGATLREWRGRGIYRALTAARARSALRRRKTLINSDSTEDSRPILERYGFTKVSTTTPYACVLRG